MSNNPIILFYVMNGRAPSTLEVIEMFVAMISLTVIFLGFLYFSSKARKR